MDEPEGSLGERFVEDLEEIREEKEEKKKREKNRVSPWLIPTFIQTIYHSIVT